MLAPKHSRDHGEMSLKVMAKGDVSAKSTPSMMAKMAIVAQPQSPFSYRAMARLYTASPSRPHLMIRPVGSGKTSVPNAGMSEGRKGRPARVLGRSALDTNGGAKALPSHDRHLWGLSRFS